MSQAIKTLFQLLGEHYVERLGNLFFWNPPTIFWGAWNTLSPLLPEATRQKIKVPSLLLLLRRLLSAVGQRPVSCTVASPCAAPVSPVHPTAQVLDVGKGGPELLELIDPSVLPADYGGQAALATPLGPQQ